MMNTNSNPLDWALWFYWIMATTLGWLLGSLLFPGIPVIGAGVAIAAFQGVILYRRIPGAWRWFLLSALGWILGYLIFVVFFSSNLGFLLGPLIGTAAGVPQWTLLRKVVEWAGWWIVISLLAWTTGLTLVPGLLTSGSLPGALTGLSLVILLRFSARVSNRSTAF